MQCDSDWIQIDQNIQKHGFSYFLNLFETFNYYDMILFYTLFMHETSLTLKKHQQ